MRLQTEGAVDATGKAIPVFVPDTKLTIIASTESGGAAANVGLSTWGTYQGTIVRIYNGHNVPIFIGTQPKGSGYTISNSTNMPIAAGATEYIMIAPEETISVKSTTVATNKIYLTPMRKF
jgi:hypothetical protein